MTHSEHYNLYQTGVALIEKKAFAEAADMLQQSARLRPHFKTFERIGECFVELGRINEAILYFSAASGLGNKQYKALYLLAKALIEIGDLDAAKAKLNEALQLNPSFKAAKELQSKLP